MEAVLEGVEEVLADDARADRMASLLKAMGHPVRLRLLARLALGGEQTVGDLSRDLREPQALVSQQLALLRLQGLVQVRPDRGFRRYRLAVAEVVTLLQCMTRCHLLQGVSNAPGGEA